MPSVFDQEYPKYSALVRSKYPELPQDWKPLNRSGINELFNELSACVELGLDGVPLPVAYRLFGWRIMEGFWADLDRITHGKSASYQEIGAYRHIARLPSSIPVTGLSRASYMLFEPFAKAAIAANHIACAPDQDEDERALRDDIDESDRKTQEEAERLWKLGIVPEGCVVPGEDDDLTTSEGDILEAGVC